MAGNKTSPKGDRHQASASGTDSMPAGKGVSPLATLKFLEPSECWDWREMQIVQALGSLWEISHSHLPWV